MRMRLLRSGMRLTIAAALLSVAACATPPNPGEAPANPSARSNPVERFFTPDEPVGAIHPDDRGAATPAHTARAAAKLVTTMPFVRSVEAQREIRLLGALYRAAWEHRVPESAMRFLLVPPNQLRVPARMDRAEFMLRVLAELGDLPAAIVWLPSERQDEPEPRGAEVHTTDHVDHFPGTREPATRLTVRLTQRSPDGLTITGEIGDWTARVGASRQGFTARWSGRVWIIERDPARLTW